LRQIVCNFNHLLIFLRYDLGVEAKWGETKVDPSEGDIGGLVQAAFFQKLSLRVPFAQAARIEAEADMAMRLEGAENFTNDTTLRLQPRRGQDDDSEHETAPRAFVRAALDQIKREQERQREEWARTRSTVAGVPMSGTEWAALSRLMRTDNEFRQKLLDAFMARGMTLDEAEERYDRVADMAEIAAIPPAQRTEKQNQIIRAADADPEFKQDMAEAARLASSDAAPASGLSSQFSRSAAVADAPAPIQQAAVTVVPGNGFGM
jgi:hypothetical protein